MIPGFLWQTEPMPGNRTVICFVLAPRKEFITAKEACGFKRIFRSLPHCSNSGTTHLNPGDSGLGPYSIRYSVRCSMFNLPYTFLEYVGALYHMDVARDHLAVAAQFALEV